MTAETLQLAPQYSLWAWKASAGLLSCEDSLETLGGPELRGHRR